MKDTKTIERIDPAPEKHGTLAQYTVGFVLSVVATLIPYWLVVESVVTGGALIVLLFAFAVAQLFIQLLFFLHLGSELRPRWKLIALLFAILIVLIVVIGSIWIMYNLDYNMMPDEMNTYMQEQHDKGGF